MAHQGPVQKKQRLESPAQMGKEALVDAPRDQTSPTPASGSGTSASTAEPCPTVGTAKRSYLDRLPLELLATILSHVRSPKDVLSLTRCNKHLCATLLNKGNTWIWRRARQECNAGPIPDPPEGWSEARFAAFIFDGGKCEICKDYTKRMYMSFSLKVRLCKNPSCLGNFKKGSALTLQGANRAMQFIATWLPTLENFDLRARNLPVGNPYLPSQKIWRRSDMLKAVNDYNRLVLTDEGIADYKKRHETQIRRLAPYLVLCKKLVEWSKVWQALHAQVRRKNVEFTKLRAAEGGWNFQDLMETPTFGSMLKSHTNSLELLQPLDYQVILPKVGPEIEELVTRRAQRVKAQGYQKRYSDIGAHYQCMKSNYQTLSSQNIVLPSLSEFRRLPIIVILQHKEKPNREGVASELKERSIADLLRHDLQKWTANAKSALAKVLGYPSWNNPSSKVLHPADRLTARFLCTRCNHVSRKYASDGSLDFAGACQHECLGPTKKSKTLVWSADQFVPDQKGIDALIKALALMNLDAERTTSFPKDTALSHCFQCQSCAVPIVMDHSRIAGHSKRHESMELALVTKAEANAMLSHPYAPGSYAILTGRTSEVKKACATRSFVCRHCFAKTAHARSPPHTDPAQDPASNTDGVTCPVERTPPAKSAMPTKNLLTWIGLVSHVKGKHGILHMGDEDFYRDRASTAGAAS
ncbi:hypothetical protein EVG20_g2203 [Dentipellis fragilis]|uniref:F-box domain-containing protein n=1 Tax=Dentipellis fragilis TaxID=205917 RepID=A0A4Y9Z8C9_9AGAM|nr:hypothetical protein EVG20_g2203 [Dentipellis fragilis]